VRIAILSDIHGNMTAFEAAVADLRNLAPDLILHAGDLADTGSNPVGIIDQIRERQWPGVVGNTDEMLFRPASLTEFASESPAPGSMFAMIEEIACVTREALGEERIAWLSRLPATLVQGDLGVVHARPDSAWRAPNVESSDADLRSAYESIGQRVIVYGHIHRPYVRNVGGLTIANAGSVGLPYDGDPRASYLLLDDLEPSIRRVEYDIEKEILARKRSPIPHAGWIARMLQSATAQMP
jgi:putative phosphoesterase